MENTENHNFQGCKHFSSFINNSNSAISIVVEIDEVISDYLNIAYDSDQDLSMMPKTLSSLRKLRSLFLCTAIEMGEDLPNGIYEVEVSNACITQDIL